MLLAGGWGNNTCELYNPATGTWGVTGAVTGRNQYAAGVVLLPNGKVLHAGGIRYNGGSSYELVGTSSLYDPISGVWTQGPSMPLARTYVHPGVALLPNGKVLFPGGSGINVTATLFDPDAGIAPSWRPQITTISAPLAVGVPLTLTGTGFRGLSGASTSGAMDSASNYPVVQLRSLHNERSIFLAADTMANWSDTTFTSTALPSFPAGYAMATVFTNGIPSVAAIVRVIGPPSVLGITPASGPTAGGTPVTITGSNFTGATSVTIGGVAVTGFTVVDDAHITTTLPTGIVGLADVVVVGVGGTGTATGVFTFVDSLIVTTTSDVIDNADNVVSLREALAHAATLVGPQTITFGDGSADGGTDFTDATPDTITLTTIGDGTAGPSAFGITSAVTIQGKATTAIILAGGGGASNLRAFYIASSGSLTLRSLTLSGFRHKGGDGAYSGGGAAGLGGAIFNNGGALVIFASTFSGNVTEGGAGSAFSMVGYANFGTGGGLGGMGVGNDGGGPNGGTMGISSNGGFGGGGARWSSDAVNPWPGYSGAGGFGGGGGNGPLQAMSGFGGGSLYSDPTYGIKSGSAGGFGGGAGGLYVDWSGESSSGYGGGGMGGAVFNNGGTTTVTNSTFASNGAYGGFGFNYLGYGSGYGGALFSRNGKVSLLNCTISANTANQGGRGVYVLADTSDGGNNTSPGSGIMVATINNTIIGSGDIIVHDFVAGTNPLSPGGTVTTSGTGNFIRTATGFSGTVISTADPLLAPLADNGGATPTMALLPGSPAIDAGDAAAASSLTTDQRGADFDRSVVSVDSGSFESRGFIMVVDGGDNQKAHLNTAFANPLSVAISSSFGEPVDGGHVTFTAPGSGASASLTPSPAIIAAGVASVTAQSNTTLGTYNVAASASGADTSPVFALTNGIPTVTPTTTVLTNTAKTVTITGIDFETTPGNNTVVFNNGAIGTVTAATATSLTVTFSTPPTSYGSLTAVVTNIAGSSGAPVQVANVANIIATLTGGALTITDVANGDDTLSFSESAGNLVISADASSVISSNAGTGSGTNSVTIPLASITSLITVNAAGGTDIINIGAFSTALNGLTLNGGTGNDAVNLNGSITFAVDTNLDVDLQNDDASPGIDNVAVGINARIATSGTGTITLKVSQNINTAAGSHLSTASGDLTLEAAGDITTAGALIADAGNIVVLADSDASGSGVFTSASPVPTLPTGAVLHYTMNEAPATNGVTLTDSSGSGNSATVFRSAGDGAVAGKFGGAVSFPGGTITEYAIANPVSGSWPTTALTVSAWVKMSVPSNAKYLFSYAVPGTDNEILFSANDIWINGNSVAVTTVSPILDDYQFHHIAMTWDSVGGALVVYVDGVQKFAGTITPGSPITGGGSLVLGQDQDSVGGGFSSGQAFGGLLDEVAVFTIVLYRPPKSPVWPPQPPSPQARAVSIWPPSI